MSYLWRIELFGGLRVVFNPDISGPESAPTIERFRTQKTAALLAYLACYPKAHAREVLTELLWPEQDPKTGGQNLRTALASLRRQFEPPGIAAGAVLLATRVQVQLNPQSVTTDTEPFRLAIRDAKTAFDRAFQIENYERAIALYNGRLLPGFYEEWVSREAEYLESEYFAALLQLLHHYQSADNWIRVRQLAQMGARFEDAPEEFSEILHRLETENAQVARSSPAQPGGQDKNLTGDFVANNKSSDYNQATQKLQPTKLAQDKLAVSKKLNPLISPDRTASQKTNSKAKDNAKSNSKSNLKAKSGFDESPSSEKVSTADELALEALNDFAVAKSGNHPANNKLQVTLPPQFTRFFGREHELARILQEFDSGTRLLTLTGAGGAGKTRLAVEAARRLSQNVKSQFQATQNPAEQNQISLNSEASWPQTICFVPLADLRDAALLSTAIIHALQLPRAEEKLLTHGAAAEAYPGERLVTALQARPALLVFDNFEHLTEASSLLEMLLSRVEHLKILVTSQHRLHVAGERELPVPPLPIPDVGAEFDAVSSVPSVQLFVDRAQLARPDFQITPHNAGDIATLCIELDGAPLALELAAARIGVFTPAQIATQLASMREEQSGRLDFLHHSKRPATARHLSLRTAIAWSYALLPPELALFWTRLAVFRGGFSPEAAESVCHQQSALHLLSQLRNYSLIAVEERDAVMRFRWPEMLREFAFEQLQNTEDFEAIHRHHAEYFCDLLADTVLRLRTPDEPAALRQAAVESDNAREAFDWIQRHQEYSLAASLGLSFGITLQRRGLHREAHDQLESGINAAAHLPDSYITRRIDLLRESAGVHLDLMEWSQARRDAQTLWEICEHIGDGKGLADAANLMGLAAKSACDWNAARDYFQRALQGFTQLQDVIGIANANNNLGLIEYLDENGDKDLAHHHLQETLRLRWELSDARSVAESFVNLGALAQMRGDLDEASRYYREALGIEMRLDHIFGVGRALCNLGEIAEENEDFQSALRLFSAAQSLFEMSGAAYQEYSAQRIDQLLHHVTSGEAMRKTAQQMARAGEITALVAWTEAAMPTTSQFPL